MSQNAPLHSWLLGVKANVRPIAEKGRPSQKVLEVGVGLPVPKYRERAWNEGRSGKMGGSQGCGSWKEEMVSTKHPIMTSLSRVC